MLIVSLDLLNLFILLSQLPVDLTFDLSQLQVDTKNFGFLVFQGCLNNV